MSEGNQKNINNIGQNMQQQGLQNNQTINIPIQNDPKVEVLIQNIIAERNALKSQNLSLWNIIEKQRTMIQKLQNQIALLQQSQSQKRKGKHSSDKQGSSEDVKEKKSSHHPLPDVPVNSARQNLDNCPAPPQRGTSYSTQPRQNSNSPSSMHNGGQLQNQMGTLLNEKYIRKTSAPSIKDNEVVYDLRNRVRSNSENAIIDENAINNNFEMGGENNVENDDNNEERPVRTDSNGNYTPPHPERLSSNKQKSKQQKSSTPLSIPIQIDTVRVKVIGSIIKINEKGKEIVSFIILISKLNAAGAEENEKIEKTYMDFVQLDSKLRSQPENKVLVAKMGKLPEKSLFTSNSPTKRDQRKIELELYLQNLILVFKNNKDLDTFLSSNVVETQINPLKGVSTKEGYLIKKGKNFGGWKTRYFVLADNILSYYDSNGGSYGGTIKLKNSQVISLPNEANDYRHGFMIMEYRKQIADGSSEKMTGKHILCAENDEERDEWIIAIGQAIESVSQEINDQVDSDINSVHTPDKQKNNLPDNEMYESVEDLEESVPNSNYSSTNSLQSGYQNQVYIPQQNTLPIGMKNKAQQSLSNSQSSSYSEFDFQKSGDFVDENERLMQQVVEPPFGISTPTSQNATLSSQKKSKKTRDEKKKRLWGRNKSKQEYSKSGGRRVFGLSLAEAIAASKIKANYELPAVVYRCIEYLDANDAQNEEGIYRLSGSASTIQALKDKFNTEGDFDLINAEEYYDIHAVAGLLKLFLRELTEPILTRELQPKFLHIPELESRNQKIYELANLISLLPLENYTLLRCLSAHLVRIVQNCSVNKMTLHNVTIVFSPTLNIPAGVFMLLLSEFQIIFCWTNQQQLQQQLIPDEEQQKLYMAQQQQQQQQMRMQQQQQQQQMYSPKLQSKTISANNLQNIGNNNQGQQVNTLPHSKTVPLMQNMSNYSEYSNPNSSIPQDAALPPKPYNPQFNKLQSDHSNRNSVSYMDGLPEHMKINEMMAMKKGQKLESVHDFDDSIDILDIVPTDEN